MSIIHTPAHERKSRRVARNFNVLSLHDGRRDIDERADRTVALAGFVIPLRNFAGHLHAQHVVAFGKPRRYVPVGSIRRFRIESRRSALRPSPALHRPQSGRSRYARIRTPRVGAPLKRNPASAEWHAEFVTSPVRSEAQRDALARHLLGQPGSRIP